MKRLILYLLLCICLSAQAAHDGIFIIIHGTWACHNDWYRPGGDFFDVLEISAKHRNKKVVAFTWNGKLDHASRLAAGQMLAKLIQSYPPSLSIYLVGHSHGGNIGIIASQILGKDKHNHHSIQALFALGTPVNTKNYMPDMSVIKKFYNLFSLKDMVQPIFGFCEREFPKHPAIANIRVFFNDEEPGHKELACPMVARCIPMMHEEFAKCNIGNFRQFAFTWPGLIHFYSDGKIVYSIEATRSQALEEDRYRSTLIMETITRALKKRSLPETTLLEVST